MLVNVKDMLTKAVAGHYAVGHFNINNLEWTKAILETAEEMKSPVILGVSEGAGKYMGGFKTVAAMADAMVDSLGITVPVALHLDHGTYEGCLKCIEAGFSSIMFDGSSYPIEENVEKTKELVKICADKGMSLEAEVGAIGGEEDGVKLMGLPVGRTKVAVYAINGFCSALAGIAYVLVVKSGWNMALQGGELEVISSAVIGGTLLTGGVGYMIGTMFGVLLKSVIPAIINFNGSLSSWWGKIATGALLLLFIVIQRAVVSYTGRKSKK